MVKLSCVGSMGLSFMGTLRATHIRHDWKSKKKKKRERRGRTEEQTEQRKDDVEDVTKRTGQRHKA